MNKFYNKSISKVIIIPTLFIIIFNCIFPTVSKADSGIGGQLFKPLMKAVQSIGDSILNVLQDVMMPGSPKAVVKRNMADLSADELKVLGSTLTSVASGLTKVPILGDALVFVDNGIVNGIEWVKSKFTGDEPEYDQLKEFYKVHVLPIILYSPATIFYNRVPALDVNFIKPSVTYAGGKGTYTTADKSSILNTPKYTQKKTSSNNATKYENNTAYQLRDTIATWYTGFRNIAMVALLSVLIYVAIRIILSSTAGETAKYKQMLQDWALAICLLFVMHYMMALLMDLTDSLTDIVDDKNVISQDTGQDIFMQNMRIQADCGYDSEGKEDMSFQFGYTLIYIALIFYTVIFTCKYLIRLVYLAFLTMIAPLVAVSYPLDKIGDGKAQAFTIWFREYVFNILLQPMHMLLYTMMVSSVSDFAQKNPIYAVVAIGFLLPAERLVRKMFGFDKAQEGGLSSAVTGAAVMNTVSSIAGKAKSAIPSISTGGKSSSSSSSDNSGKIRYSDKDSGELLSGFKNGGNQTSIIGGTGTSGTTTTGRTLNGGGNGRTITSGSSNNSRNQQTRNRTNNSPQLKKTIPIAKRAQQLGIKAAKFPVRTVKGVGKMSGKFVKKAAKPTIKFAAKAAGGVVGGTIGMAAGLTQGSPSAAIGGAIGGAVGGSKLTDEAMNLGTAAANFASDRIGDFKEGFYTDEELAEKNQKKYNKEMEKQWKKDKDIIKQFQQEYGKDYKKKMDEALELKQQGVDEKDLMSALNLMDRNQGLSSEQAANIIDFSKGLNKKDLLNKDTRKSLKERAKMITGDDQQADKVMDLVEQKLKLK